MEIYGDGSSEIPLQTESTIAKKSSSGDDASYKSVMTLPRNSFATRYFQSWV